MAYYPRVFYENGDAGGGGDSAAGGGDPNRAAASIAESVEQQKNLTEAYSETQKLEAQLQVAREAGLEEKSFLNHFLVSLTEFCRSNFKSALWNFVLS